MHQIRSLTVTIGTHTEHFGACPVNHPLIFQLFVSANKHPADFIGLSAHIIVPVTESNAAAIGKLLYGPNSIRTKEEDDLLPHVDTLNKSIDVLLLPPAAHNALETKGFKRIWQVVERTEKGLRMTCHFSHRSGVLIKEALEHFGLTPGMNLHPIRHHLVDD